MILIIYIGISASTNKWYNLVVTHTQGSPFTFYINGVSVHTTANDSHDFDNWSIRYDKDQKLHSQQQMKLNKVKQTFHTSIFRSKKIIDYMVQELGIVCVPVTNG